MDTHLQNSHCSWDDPVLNNVSWVGDQGQLDAWFVILRDLNISEQKRLLISLFRWVCSWGQRSIWGHRSRECRRKLWLRVHQLVYVSLYNLSYVLIKKKILISISAFPYPVFINFYHIDTAFSNIPKCKWLFFPPMFDVVFVRRSRFVDVERECGGVALG